MPSAAAKLELEKDQAEIIDRFGELRRQIKNFAPTREEYDALSKEIASWYEGFPPSKTDLLEGHIYDIQVSAQENRSQIIDNEKVYRKLGRERFIEIATIHLDDLRRELPKESWPKFIVTTRTGKRRFEPVLKAPAPRKVA